MAESKSFSYVNKKLLPIKVHFLVLFGGYGGVKPFQSLIGKGLNISATAVGFTNTTLMGLTLLFKPIIGSLVDYFRNIRIFIICLVLLNALSTLSLLLLFPIEKKAQESTSMRVQITNSSEIISIPLPFSLNYECTKKWSESSEINCYVFQMNSSFKTGNTEDNVKEFMLDSFQFKDFQEDAVIGHNNDPNVNDTFAIYLHSKVTNIVNFSNLFQHELLDFKCQPDIVHLCHTQACATVNEYETYQFWAYASLVIIAGLASGNANSLSDVACYEILGEQRHMYGRQRLFGTVGWASISLLSGYLSDLATGGSKIKDYSPGFYVMVCLILMDTFILWKLPLENGLKMSTNIYRDIKKVFHSSEIVLFAVSSVLIGSLTATIAYYELWYLQDLGANQSLLGWTIIVQCFIAELPFFIISGWFVKKFGSFNCLVGSFVAYALRFGCYAIIENPWWALLIDTTHGFTFAMFHAAMTNFVSLNASEGIEGTMFGIFGGLIDGLGQASGCLLCGAAFDKLGGRLTFTIASIFSGACAIAILILSRLLAQCPNRTKKESISL